MKKWAVALLVPILLAAALWALGPIVVEDGSPVTVSATED